MTEVKVVRDEIPAWLLTCAPAPAVPEIAREDPQGSSKAAVYVAQVHAAGEDCRATVRRTKEWSERPAPETTAAMTHVQISAIEHLFLWLGSAAGPLPPEVAMRRE